MGLSRFLPINSGSLALVAGKPHDIMSMETSYKRHKPPRPTYTTHKDLFLPFGKYLRWQSDIERSNNYTPNVSRYYSNTRYKKNVSDGEARLRRVEQVLDSMYPNGKFVFQIKLHRQVIRAVLRQILAEDYERLVEKVCKERGWDGPKKNLFTIASRRSGKTTGMAGLVATLLICVPHIQIVVYSVALRTATEFVRLVERYICMHPGGSQMIVNPGGSETLMVSGTEPADTRRIRSFPSGGNAKNVRFVSPHPFFSRCVFSVCVWKKLLRGVCEGLVEQYNAL